MLSAMCAAWRLGVAHPTTTGFVSVTGAASPASRVASWRCIMR